MAGISTRESLARQKKFLQGLGFGFVTEALPEAAPREVENPRRKTTGEARADRPRSDGGPSLSLLPALNPEQRTAEIDSIAEKVRTCTACDLHLSRLHAVPGEGSISPRAMFIMEHPTVDDDAEGKPARGEIGRMFRDIVKAMKLSLDDVYTTQAVKCFPPGSRAPKPEELEACSGYLTRQIEILRPEIIVCFGIAPLITLLPGEARTGIQKLRGEWLEWRGTPLMVTLALPYIHGNPARKKMVWSDLQLVMKRLGL